MEKNVGKVDKIIRFIAGIFVLILGIVYQSWWGLLGLIPIFVAILGKCYFYKLFGISTKKKIEESVQNNDFQKN